MREPGRRLLEQARERGYLVARQNAQGDRVAELWYRECEAERKPFVRVRPRKAYASLTLDMLPTEGELSKEGQQALEATILERWAAAPWIVGTGWFPGENMVLVPTFPIAEAAELAQYLVQVALDYRRDRPPVHW